METFEFHVYAASPNGEVSAEPIRIERLACFDAAAAKSVARRLAKSQPGPVDVARAGASPWNDRYVGTASRKWPEGPSLATIFERLD